MVTVQSVSYRSDSSKTCALFARAALICYLRDMVLRQLCIIYAVQMTTWCQKTWCIGKQCLDFVFQGRKITIYCEKLWIFMYVYTVHTYKYVYTVGMVVQYLSCNRRDFVFYLQLCICVYSAAMSCAVC